MPNGAKTRWAAGGRANTRVAELARGDLEKPLRYAAAGAACALLSPRADHHANVDAVKNMTRL